MESQRQQKYGRLIQKELAEIFQRDIKSLFEGAMVTITDVKMSPDLSQAKVYVSFLLVKDKKEALEKIREQKPKIRGILGNAIKKQVRVVPDLHFFIDDVIDHAIKMDELISKLNIPKEKKDPDAE